ncbi:MAG: hypothetical protein ACYDBB_00720 [Armatimonadota bacterium]
MPRVIHWLLLCLCAGALLPTMAQQKLLPNQIKPDARMMNTPGTEIYLMRARPAKLFNWQSEPVTGVAEILNNTEVNKALSLRAWITNDLDQVVGLQQRTVNLPPFTRLRVEFTWKPALLAPYGHAMVIEVLLDGKLVAKGEDYFSTADNVWAVGIAGNHPMGYTAQASGLPAIEGSVERFRAAYTNTFEKFFWAPDDFGDMTPSKEKWFSGQVRYYERFDYMKHMCAYGRSIGVLPTTYGKSLGSGSAARDIIRERPELVHGYGEVLNYFPDTEELAKWDLDDATWQSTGWAFYNMNDPAVVQVGIEEIANSAKMFGWAGVRFDGHFQARTGKQRVGEKFVDFTPDMADTQTAANQKALKDYMRKVDPRFTFGYNYAEADMTGRFINNPRETLELCDGGGHIMDEYAKGSAGPNHPKRRWADYAEMVVKSAEQVRRAGGHYFPMVNPSGPVGRYQTLFTFAGGGHPNSIPWAIDHPYNAFATRYAGVLWHKNLVNLWNPSGVVMAPSRVM